MVTEKQLRAFTESGKEWFYQPRVEELDGRLHLHIWGPIAYWLDQYFLDSIRNTEETLFCIDRGGRNHGVEEPVFIKVQDILALLAAYGVA